MVTSVFSLAFHTISLAFFQLLISGSTEGFDVKDLRAHTNYAGGYHSVSSFYVLRWRLTITSSVFVYQQ